MFDIDKIAATTEATYRVQVGFNPKDDGTPGEPVGFVVVGPSSAAFQAAEREITVLNLNEAEKRKRALDLSTKEDAALFVGGNEQRRLLLAKRCVVGWYGFMQGTAEAPFTPENLHTVLASRPHWVKRIVAEIENGINFDGA
jgi:hypothetical protein